MHINLRDVDSESALRSLDERIARERTDDQQTQEHKLIAVMVVSAASASSDPDSVSPNALTPLTLNVTACASEHAKTTVAANKAVTKRDCIDINIGQPCQSNPQGKS